MIKTKSLGGDRRGVNREGKVRITKRLFLFSFSLLKAVSKRGEKNSKKNR